MVQSKVRYNSGMLDNSSGAGQGVEPLAPVGKLDYEKTQLMMEVGNVIESSYRIRSCDKEPWTVQFIESCPAGSWFIDIGASSGPYTLVAVANNLNVLAIEPSFESYRRLCRNLALNQMLDRAIVMCCALGKEIGFNWMNYYDLRPGAGANRIGDIGKQTWHRQLIPIYPLDWLIQQLNPDADFYVKLDVDGDEDSVLFGMSGFLHDPRLKGIIAEVPIALEQSITDRFAECGLKLVNKYDERAGQKMGEVWYGEYRR